MPSGKQVLLHFLNKYSLALQKEEDLAEASENLRVAFLLHGSTSNAMWHHVENIEWGTEQSDKQHIKQGLKIKNKDISLSELFEYITTEDDTIPQQVKERFPDLLLNEYKSAMRMMSLLLKSIEHSSWLAQVENKGILDMEQLEKSLIAYKKNLNYLEKTLKIFHDENSFKTKNRK